MKKTKKPRTLAVGYVDRNWRRYFREFGYAVFYSSREDKTAIKVRIVEDK